MAHCDGTGGCGRFIRATADDPVHHISEGRFCSSCMNKRSNAPAKPAPDARGKSARKSAASRARWDAMTPEQKAERVAKLQAGRKKQQEVAP